MRGFSARAAGGDDRQRPLKYLRLQKKSLVPTHLHKGSRVSVPDRPTTGAAPRPRAADHFSGPRQINLVKKQKENHSFLLNGGGLIWTCCQL
ncbi:unnamed protein product [Pleuronectes platessa]|uniref:Uncharacterized protein n=1 Tax=Pleuronectes platessa TaxID=8262 RepID=A0A9N7TKQ7_PLEPL|nr:unnamed protein product [Pleuronectes platessa]